MSLKKSLLVLCTGIRERSNAMSSMNSIINKLLKALEYKKGIIYCIDRKQYYSSNLKRRCTKYIVHTNEQDQVKHYFNKQIEVILFLVKQLGDDS